jgi:hypothetical protein
MGLCEVDAGSDGDGARVARSGGGRPGAPAAGRLRTRPAAVRGGAGAGGRGAAGAGAGAGGRGARPAGRWRGPGCRRCRRCSSCSPPCAPPPPRHPPANSSPNSRRASASFPRRPGLAAGTAELALRHGFVDTARWGDRPRPHPGARSGDAGALRGPAGPGSGRSGRRAPRGRARLSPAGRRTSGDPQGASLRYLMRCGWSASRPLRRWRSSR